MKRNWDLIRLMLLGIEDCTLHKIRGYNTDEILYHFFLLEGARFIENTKERGIILTPKGDELVSTLRDPMTYQKAMKIIESKDVGATEEILVALIKKLKADLAPNDN